MLILKWFTWKPFKDFQSKNEYHPLFNDLVIIDEMNCIEDQ